MKICIILLTLFSLSAQAQVLGELKGQGQIQASYATFSGSKDVRTSPCNVAMNIHQKPGSFELEFSVFECPKLDNWNDPYYAYSIVNGQLIDSTGAVKGAVAADGSIQFTEKSMSLTKYYLDTYDATCRLLYSTSKTLALNTVINYSFKQNTDGSWQVHRQTSEDRLAYTTHRDYPTCPAQTIPTKLGSTTDLSVVVK